jgi:hypothetical protein
MTTSDTTKEAALARQLAASRFAGDEEAAWALAHALTDIAGSSAALGSLISALHGPDTDEEKLTDTMTDIGEELRQILYHLHNAPYLKDLHDGEEKS